MDEEEFNTGQGERILFNVSGSVIINYREDNYLVHIYI